MSIYTITSPPSVRLGYLRALYLRASGRSARRHGRLPAHQGRVLAEAGLDLLSTEDGYRTATALVTGASRTAWNATTAAVTAVGRTAARVGRGAARLLGRIAPKTGQRMAAAVDRTQQAATARWSTADRRVRILGAAAATALGEPAVVRTATTAAQTASLLLLLHLLTGGRLALRIVLAQPAMVGPVLTLISPVGVLGVVLGATATAVLLVMARLLADAVQSQDDGGPAPTEAPLPHEAGPAPVQPLHTAARATHTAGDLEREFDLPLVAQVVDDLEAIAKTVRVEARADGSVEVHGIPESVPPDLGEAVAEIAQQAVQQHLQRVLLIRPVPTRSDRRLFTKAAREAIHAEARRRQREGLHAVA